ncbi:MAG: 2Fe-2S iron-sulfur cluster-binding protein [Thermomicrobiales bacterium]
MISTMVWITTTDGDRFEVNAGETVLSAALKAGIDIPYSCQGGTCRTCYSLVMDGDIRHDPDYEDELLIHPDEVAEGYRLLCSSLAFADSLIKVGG